MNWTGLKSSGEWQRPSERRIQCCGVHCTEVVQERVQRRVVKNWFRTVPAGVNCIELDRVKVQRVSGTDIASAECSAAVCTV